MRMHFNISQIIYTLGLFVVCFAVSLYDSQNPLTKIYARGDTSVYQYIGKMMWQGILPYRDIFDHKGPVVYLWNMLGYGLHPMTGQWLLEFLLLLGSAFIAFKIAHKYLSELTSFIITSIVILFTPYEDTIGNTENISVFLNFAFLYYNLKLQSRPKTISFVLGFILALQLLIKPPHSILPIIFCTGTFLNLLIKKNYLLLKTFTFYTALGFISVTACFLLALEAYGGLTNFYHDYLLFNLQYTPYWKQTYSLKFITDFYLTEPIIKLQLILLVISALLCFKPNTPLHLLNCLNTITAISTIYLIIMPNNPLKHYTYMLSPILFTSLVLFCHSFNKYRASILVIITTIFIYGICQTTSHLTNNSPKEQNDVVTDTAIFLQNNLKEKEPFIVLGYDMCRLHLLTNRPFTTHYPMNPMVNRIMPQKLFTELKQAKPKFILLRVEEISHYKNSFYTYWPEFSNEYLLIKQNSEYYIFMRINP